jgi:hypothetical protein
MTYLEPETSVLASRRLHWKSALPALLAILLVADLVAAVVLPTKSRSKGTMTLMMTPGAFVTGAARNALAAKTADITVSGTVSVFGHTLPIHGTGQMDSVKQLFDMTVNMNSDGHTVLEEMLYDGRDMYMSITSDGTNAVLQQTGTATWVAIPLAQSSASQQLGSDPVTTLTLLQGQGATVKQVGLQNVDGVDCFGFSATFTPAMMAESQKKGLAASGLTPAQQNEIASSIHMKPLTITMWIDQNQIIHRLAESVAMTVSGAGSEEGQVIMDFTKYGVPVSITAPAPSQVISFSNYLSLVHG